jgi:hypothetical protein
MNTQLFRAVATFAVNLTTTEEALIEFSIQNIRPVAAVWTIIYHGSATVLHTDVVLSGELGLHDQVHGLIGR